MKKLVVSLCLLTFSNSVLADWFLSSEVKELIAKADEGDLKAQFRVGSAYDFGHGAPRSVDKALKYYSLAAEQGYDEAQNSLASGLQAAQRYSEALTWYEKAAAQNHALATNNLAYLYDLGLGVPQDRRKGFELYSRAANLGWAESMWNLANMYGAGQVGDVDMVMACVWTVRANKFAKGYDRQLKTHVSRVLPRIAATLTTEQIASCDKQAEAWSPSFGVSMGNAQPE